MSTPSCVHDPVCGTVFPRTTDADRRDAAAAARDEIADRADRAAQAREQSSRTPATGAAADRARAAADRDEARSDRHAAREERRTAAVDGLTGVYRRDTGLAELEHDFAAAQRSGSPLWVCFADVNGLKAVNDRHGHRAGDRMLRDAAHHIRTQVPCYGLVIRYGGDEFVFAALGLGEDRVRAALAVIDADTSPASVTCGLADASRSRTLAEAIAHADHALYRHRQLLRRTTTSVRSDHDLEGADCSSVEHNQLRKGDA